MTSEMQRDQRVPPMRTLVKSDLEALCAALESSGLPSSDIGAQHLVHFRGVFDGNTLLAAGGIEPLGCEALLRSVVTVPRAQRRGLAARIVRELEEYASELGIESIYLLTEAAEGYFEKMGYEACRREEAPAAIRGTVQFSELCPDSATFMHKGLDRT